MIFDIQIENGIHGCCKAAILYDFPYDYEAPWSTKDLKDKICEIINDLIKKEDGYYAVVFATCNKNQERTRQVLEELGFYGLPNPAVNERGVNIWPYMLPLNEWEHK